MNPITASSWIDSPPAEVFELATNFSDGASWRSEVTAMEVLTSGPVGKGTRIRETRKVGGHESSEEMTVTEFDPPRACVLQGGGHGAPVTRAMMFEADRDGTIVSMDIEIRPTSFVAKLMSPMMRVAAGRMRKSIAHDLGDLKSAAEKAGAVGAGH